MSNKKNIKYKESINRQEVRRKIAHKLTALVIEQVPRGLRHLLM